MIDPLYGVLAICLLFSVYIVLWARKNGVR